MGLAVPVCTPAFGVTGFVDQLRGNGAINDAQYLAHAGGSTILLLPRLSIITRGQFILRRRISNCGSLSGTWPTGWKQRRYLKKHYRAPRLMTVWLTYSERKSAFCLR